MSIIRFSSLDNHIRAEMERMTHEFKGSKESLYARLLLYRILKDHYGIKDAVIERKENKKPFIRNHKNVFFNLSHSENLVLVAVSDFDIGVDVQLIKPDIRNPLRLAKKILSDEEQLFLSSLPKEERVKEFFRFWTEKEAFSKCTGEGLNLYNTFRFNGLNTNRILYENCNYYIKEIFTDRRFRSCICTKASDEEPEIGYTDPASILDFYL